MDYILLPSGRIRFDLAKSLREAQEQNVPLVFTSWRQIDFCIVPIGFTSRSIHWAMVSRFAVDVHRTVTGITYEKQAPYILATINPEKLRRDLIAQKERIRASMVPMFFTYHHQLYGLLFPIPEGQGIESVLEIAEGWRAIVKTQRLSYE